MKRASENVLECNDHKKMKSDIYKGEACPTYRGAKDPWGFSISLRKSDFQKAVRRGNIEQALVAFYVCFNMVELFPGVSGAKSIQTNILNRIMICAMEDIGIANEQLVNHTLRTIYPMVKGKSVRDNRKIEQIIVALCKSKKVRIQSHMTHAYHVKNRELATKLGIPVSDSVGQSLSDPNWFRVAIEDPEQVWRKLGAMREKRISNEPICYQVWKNVAQSNKRAVLQYALSVAHFKAIGKIKPSKLQFVIEKVDNAMLEDIRLNKIRLDPCKEAYDIHTREGKANSDKKKFRTDGALVSNLDIDLHDPLLEQIYIESNV